MPSAALILLPPSEGKAPGGDGPPWQPGTMAVAELDPARRRLARALGARAAGLRAPTLPAIERYTGVLYKELDAASLPVAASRRLDRSVLIVSGRWGLVAPTDPIPDYRLKMGARVDPLGKLSTWWRPAITGALSELARGAVVWDLLPQEHAAALEWGSVEPRHRITARFVDRDGRTVSHWNKLLKGSLVRWLVTDGARARSLPARLDALEAVELAQGYRLDPASSLHDGPVIELTFRTG